eukprot:2066451-Pyramimonas_sp.AAC.1
MCVEPRAIFNVKELLYRIRRPIPAPGSQTSECSPASPRPPRSTAALPSSAARGPPRAPGARR